MELFCLLLNLAQWARGFNLNLKLRRGRCSLPLFSSCIALRYMEDKRL